MNYLLLEDGSYFNVKIEKGIKNILGKLTLEDECNTKLISYMGDINLQSNLSNKNNCMVLDKYDLKIINKKIRDNTHLLGKLVTDSLPLEFHVYDLKTSVPYEI
ncbi:hypothetical protein [Abyssisolibacter fermentans]|uniref:hypothetical protein n=1 Tax=Abyssisolibacter fermentans TaxID=1766203 RepID=UPI00082C1B8B|nr:hypothetical protein [Abyssisolibacter fermentans]